MTPYENVYAIVKKIPRSHVATYGQIALLAGLGRGARQVGYALRATPANMKIPWHRVVNAQGRVSVRIKEWQSGSDDLQKILLEAEGIVFDETGKLNLKRYRWKPKVSRA
jgi:methylated-DNA-protein-cysteine methyltransferase related protein